MKVALINSVYNVGSTGKIVSGLCELIRRKGYDSVVLYGRGKLSSNKSYVHYVSFYWELIFHVIMTRLFDRHGLHSYLSTKRICNILDSEKPDIVHLHNIHGYYLNLEIFFNYLIKNNIPVIWTLHDCWSFTGHCAYFDKVDCQKWQVECNKCPQINTYPTAIFNDRSKANFNLKKSLFKDMSNLHIVGVSQWIFNLAKKSFLNDKLNGVIYNGVDTNIFFPRSFNLIKNKYRLDNCFILLSVAKIWEPRKGLDELILLINSLPENFILIIVGKVDNLPGLKSNKVIFVNELSDQNELAEYYSSANLFINLSTEDNLPMTIMESIACGTPVLSYDTGGCSEVICGNYGKVFKKGDINSLVNFIKYNIEDFVLKFDNLTMQDINIKYSQELQFQNYIDLYLQIINKSKNIN